MAIPVQRLRSLLEDLPIRPTIAFAIIVGLVLPISLAAWRNIAERREVLLRHLHDDHLRLVEVLAIGMQTPIWEVRPETGRPLMEAILRDDRVRSVAVSAPLMPDFLRSARPTEQGEKTIIRDHTIFRDGEEIGSVRLEMSMALLEAELSRQWRDVLVTGTLQLAFGLLLVFPLLRYKVLAPLGQLVLQSEALARGELDRQFQWRQADEFGALGRSFEETRRSLGSLFTDLASRNAELQHREEELARQAAILRGTLDNMTDGITLVDQDLRLLAWNDRFLEILEFPEGLVQVGMPITDLHQYDVQRGRYGGQQAEAFLERMRAGFQSGRPMRTQAQQASGRVIQIRRQPIPEGGFVTTYTDVTEQVVARRKADESLQLLEAVMDAVPAVLSVKDRNLRYQMVNRQFLETWGLQRDQVIGRTAQETFDPACLAGVQERDQEVIDTGMALPFYESSLNRPPAEPLAALTTKVPLRDSKGAVTHIVTVILEISERKKAEQALQESEELYRLLVDFSPYGVLLHDDSGIVFINPAGCRILGESDADRLVGRHYLEFVVDSERSAAAERIRRVLREGHAIKEVERQMVAADGRRITVVTAAVPLSRSGRSLALVIFLDITERKRTEAEIARQKEALHQSEKMSALGSLLSGVAHELNNPLSVVVGRAIMLEESDLDPRITASVGKIRAAAERCARIVKTFLAMAREQAPSRVPVRIETVIEGALDLVGQGLRGAGIRIDKVLPPDLPEILADPDQLGQVFTNLFLNAKQAMEASQTPRILSITADVDGDGHSLRIRIADSGPGIEETALPRIFDPFFTTKPPGVGTGIGLAVTRGIIESHGGTISVASPSAGGATFEIILPGIIAPGAIDESLATDTRPAARSRSILVVDDEPEIAAMLTDILTAAGHRAETAGDGRQALRRLREQRYDLIISDLLMPNLDGPGLYREIEANDPEMRDRVVFITGDTLSAGAKRFLAQAQRPVIEKPFVPEDVHTVIGEVLDQSPKSSDGTPGEE
jgi:PAS domain S-box-containing protein